MDWIRTLNVCNYAIGCLITANKLWVRSYNCHDFLKLVHFRYGILVVDHTSAKQDASPTSLHTSTIVANILEAIADIPLLLTVWLMHTSHGFDVGVTGLLITGSHEIH